MRPIGRATDGPDPRWEAFAAREPYYAVLTAPRFRRANLTVAREREFFTSGETQVDAIFRTIELRLAPHFAPTALLEYGCGVGRLALPLARRAGRRAGHVTAVDRSPVMLAAARQHAERSGVNNLSFCTPADLFASPGTFDFVNCYLVFQRIPRDTGVALLGELLKRIRPGGIGVFQFPYRTSVSASVQSARWLRDRVPGVNALANLLRGKPVEEPFIASHTYALDDVLRSLDDASLDAAHIVFEHHADLASAIVFTEVPMSRAEVPGDRDPQLAPPIDVRELVASTSLADLNRAAEHYFASLTDWDHHLAKPFSNADEAPLLLTDVVMMLQGLRVSAGDAVLEFGAGTGWLSRLLTQLGCRAIVLDVSPTALRMARELYARLPPIGDRPAPEFLQFDGRCIELPDASVDRIVCLHALHHTPNPHDVIAEFGRILMPGGIAGFAEPGPRHSRSAFSQFEMRTYGVVENDVDVHDLWNTARACGFERIELAVFHGPPFHLTLAEYEDFLAGGPTSGRWSASTRVFLRNVRSFFLFKAGAPRADSRLAEGLACEIHATLPARPAAGAPIAIDVSVTNSGSATWLASGVDHGGVSLGVHLYDDAGRLIAFAMHREPLTAPPQLIAPGDTVHRRLTLRPLEAGS